MLHLAADMIQCYEAELQRSGIDHDLWVHFLTWLRFYLDFCAKYGFAENNRGTFRHFNLKLQEKGQMEWQRRQAHEAVKVYFRMSNRPPTEPAIPLTNPAAPVPRVAIEAAGNIRPAEAEPTRECRSDSVNTQASSQSDGRGDPLPKANPGKPSNDSGRSTAPNARQTVLASSSTRKPRPPSEDVPKAVTVTDRAAPLPSPWDQVHAKLEAGIKVRHYSSKTLKTYAGWTRKLQRFTHDKDPASVNVEDVKAFLTHLAVEKHVAASSQNQAFNALLFLFRHVFDREFGQIDGVARAKRKPYVPVVLAREEVDRVLKCMTHPYDLVAKLLYGCGLRLFECLKIRVQDVNFDAMMLTVHDGKGKKDRTVPLPQVLRPDLEAQIERVRAIHRSDLATGYAGTFLPDALGAKYKNAAIEFPWQWLFPAATLTHIAMQNEYRRYHLHESRVQKAIKQADN